MTNHEHDIDDNPFSQLSLPKSVDGKRSFEQSEKRVSFSDAFFFTKRKRCCEVML
jgi:hypothetical protein